MKNSIKIVCIALVLGLYMPTRPRTLTPEAFKKSKDEAERKMNAALETARGKKLNKLTIQELEAILRFRQGTTVRRYLPTVTSEQIRARIKELQELSSMRPQIWAY